MQILDVIIPELLERREADLRKQRMAARVRTQLNNILANEGGYAGRWAWLLHRKTHRYPATAPAAWPMQVSWASHGDCISRARSNPS